MRFIGNLLKLYSGANFVTRRAISGLHVETLQRQTFLLKCAQHYSSATPVQSILITMKLDNPEFRSLFTTEMNMLIELFEKHNFELRIAGGAVRDLLSGKKPSDVDFATTATPAEMKDLFNAEGIRLINAKGESHGTITCRLNDTENFEVTTLRIDKVTDGRHAQVEFTRDWELDALRRDLTINSMFLGFDGTVYDYFNGAEDLKNQKVRFVGSAEDRIREDYLRILRYFRFYGRVVEACDAHEDATIQAIHDNAEGLSRVSGERIWLELKKIAVGSHAASLLKTMMDCGLAAHIGLPQADKDTLLEVETVWQRCKTLEPHPMTVICALLRSQDDVLTLHGRIKMSRDEQRLAAFIVQHRSDEFDRSTLDYVMDLMCDTTGKEPITKQHVCELLKYLGETDLLSKFNEWEMPKFPFSGNHLVVMGVPKGHKFGEMLKAIRNQWKESRYESSEEQLMEYARSIQHRFMKKKK